MAEKAKKEVLVGTIVWNKEEKKSQLSYKDASGNEQRYDFKTPLKDNELQWLKELNNQKKEVNGKQVSRGNKTIVTVEGDKEYRDILPGDVRIDKKFYSFYGFTDNNGEKRINMKTMTNVMTDYEVVKKFLEKNPYCNVLACLALEVEGEKGKKEFIQVPKGMFSPKRKGLSAEDYVKRLKGQAKFLYEKLKAAGNTDMKLVTFMSVCELTGVSPKGKAGEIIEKHFLHKEGAEKKDLMAYGYIPMNKYLPQNSQKETWGLHKVPTPLFYAENPMSYKVREATAEERKNFKFDEVEKAIVEERAAREEEYRQNQAKYEASESKISYTSFDDEPEQPLVPDEEEMESSVMANDDDSPFGPSY